MGRTDKEFTKVTPKRGKRGKELVPGVDYYVVKVKSGELSPGGWVYCTTTRGNLTKEKVASLLAEVRSGNRPRHLPTVHDAWYSPFGYYLVPGAKPDPKWGPVSP